MIAFCMRSVTCYCNNGWPFFRIRHNENYPSINASYSFLSLLLNTSMWNGEKRRSGYREIRPVLGLKKIILVLLCVVPLTLVLLLGLKKIGLTIGNIVIGLVNKSQEN